MKKEVLRFAVAVFALVYACVLFFSSFSRRNVVAESIAPGKAECVIELNSGRVLYESRGDTRLPMASTTKIATAATVLRLCDDLREEVTIPTQAVGVEGSSVYLKSGEIYTVEELLYGLMLRSGNDCAVALALHCCGSVENFSSKMNETTQKAGALNSRFSNPHGLPCEGHYTSAQDLSYIARYAMQNQTFQKIVSTKYYEPRHWQNKNKMLTGYEGAIGIKTGYTKEAGRCLVSAAKRGNMTLICTVLNCPLMYERSAELLDGAFQTYDYKPLMKANDSIQVGEQVGCTRKDIYYPMSEGEEEQLEVKTFPICNKKNKEIIGQFQIYLSKRLLFSGNLYKL